MLRKKLSKLIVSIMTVAVISGGMGVGQVAFANSNVEVVSVQARTVQNATNAMDMLTHVQTSTVSTINVTASIELTKDIVAAINSRTTPLTIEVQQGGSLTISDAINLDGKSSSLKIVRGAGNQVAMIETATQNTGGTVQASITGVTFDNAGLDLPAFANDVVNNIKVTLNGNTLSNGGDLSSASTNNVYTSNILGAGSLIDTQNIVFTIKGVEGSTTITMNGTTGDYASIGAATATTAEGLVTLTVTDANGNYVGESGFPVDSLGNFSGEVISGLKAGQVYNVTGEAVYTDKNGNTYTRTTTAGPFTTINFSSSVTNIGNNSATINISHGNLPASSYNLELTVTGGTTTIAPVSISASMNSVNLTGLLTGTSYTYEIKDVAGNIIDKGTFKTTSSTITGNAGSGSVTTGDLTSSDINKADIKDVSASIPVGSTTLLNSLKNGKDYKTNIEGVSVTFTNDKIELSGLVPGKDYKDLTITYTDKDGRTRTVKVPTFKTKTSETKLRQFIVDVYSNSLSRTPDERGFAYWEDQLKNKKTTPEEFVKNLLNEKEFIEKHKTTTEKIEALYKVIVNRSSDSQGLSYWTTKYDDLVKKGYSESMALKVTVDEMVNEQEFKNRVKDLGL